MDKNHLIFKDQRGAEKLTEFVLKEGYDRGLDYALTKINKCKILK